MKNTPQRIWTLLTAVEKRSTAVMLALVVLMALAETASVISIMPFLSVLGRPEIVQENPGLQWLYRTTQAQDTRAFIATLGLMSIAVVIGAAAFKTVTLHLINRFIHMLRHSISTRLLERYLAQPYEFFLRRNSAELSKNVLSEADQLTFSLLQPLSMLIAHGTVVIAMVALIVVYDPWMAFYIVTLIAALYGAIYVLVRKRLVGIGRDRQRADIGRYQAASETLGGIKDVKVTNSAGVWLDAYSRNSREVSRHAATAETLSASPLYIVEAVGYSGLILIALFLLIRSNDIGQVLPALGMYGFAAYRLLPAAQIMYRGFARLQYSSATLDVVHRDLALPTEPKLARGVPIIPRKEIRLQGIRYAYPNTLGRPILDGFDLTIPANATLAIAGQSGAGKSTLMDILLGLVQPQAGALMVDGVTITTTNVASWQQAIGYVPQHIYLADASVAENIAFGVPHNEIDMAAVETAARTAQIHEYIVTELEAGYNTTVGDRGIRLSGGQRQRIGIARALYRDPPILMMDEATSALDKETEVAVNSAMRNLVNRKTIIVVAHRDITINACDSSIILNKYN